jgi:hypothetical protein
MDYRSKELPPFLSSENISTSLEIRYSVNNASCVSRIDYIKRICEGKNVLHVGCVDHKEVILRKIKSSTFLHKELCSVSKKCIGVDINKEGVDYLRNLGFIDVFALDITKVRDDTVMSDHWDYVLLPEIIEHVSDPTLFIKEFLSIYSSVISKVIITVPNAFRAGNWKAAKESKELINSDHKFWFSPYTLQKITYLAGLELEQLLFYDYLFDIKSKNSRVRNYLKIRKLYKSPMLCSGLIGVFVIR